MEFARGGGPASSDNCHGIINIYRPGHGAYKHGSHISIDISNANAREAWIGSHAVGRRDIFCIGKCYSDLLRYTGQFYVGYRDGNRNCCNRCDPSLGGDFRERIANGVDSRSETGTVGQGQRDRRRHPSRSGLGVHLRIGDGWHRLVLGHEPVWPAW